MQLGRDDSSVTLLKRDRIHNGSTMDSRHPPSLPSKLAWAANSRAAASTSKALRTIVRLRKMDANERAEQETILETYMQALGML
jgi:hypothetical protein